MCSRTLGGLDETCVQEDSTLESCELDTSEAKLETTENLLLKQLKSCLAGVPPGPKLTHPQQTIEEILDVLNKDDWKSYESNRNGCLHVKFNCDECKGQNCSWPEVKHCVFFDISYNLSRVTEDIADLCDKYRERYVGYETSSFVTSNCPSRYSGKKTEPRKTRSPKSCTYLSRRRKMFSQSSFQEACRTNKFGLAQKTILMPKRGGKGCQTGIKRALFKDDTRKDKAVSLSRSPSKLKAMEIRRSLWLQRKLTKGNTPKKLTPSKSTPSKQTPKKNSTPAKRTPKKYGTPRKSTPRKNNTPRKNATPRRQTPKKHSTPRKSGEYRNLNANGKRSFSEVESNDESSFNRLTRSSMSSDDSRSETSGNDLSETQRRKLLWAVSGALKQAGISGSHKNFRIYGRKLFKICRLEWLRSSSTISVKQGISEQMLSLASKHVITVKEEVDLENDNLDIFYQNSNSSDFFLHSENSNN